MKKLLTILFLFCSLVLPAQTIWYVSESGNNANPGTYSQPKRNFYNMITDPSVSAGDKVLSLGGIFYETRQIPVPLGVSVEGDPEGSTYIESSLATAGQPLFLLETGTGGSWVNGNQFISHLTIDGNLTTYAAIYVNFRSNVKIHHCTILDFVRRGVRFFGNPMYTWTADNIYSDHPTNYTKMPSRFCTGNEFTNNIINNCSDYYGGNGNGCLLVGQQDGMLIYGNTITQTGRASGLNGYGIKFDDNGFNKNTKIHDNTITVAKYGDTPHEFAIEWWWDLGGTEIYRNRITGAIDLVHAVRGPGTTWSVKIYDNIIGYETIQRQLERGILYEGRIEYCHTYRNLIKNISTAWYRPLHNYSLHDQLSNSYFYDNLLMNLGNSGTDYQTWGFYYPDYTDQDPSHNIHIYNNTIIANPNRTRISRWGIQLPNGYETHGVYIKNNIIVGFDGAAIYAAYNRAQFDTLQITNNILYGNGNSNNPQWASGFSPTHYVINNIIKSDPILVSNTDYHLQSGSPAIRAGIWVGVIYDYAGLNWLDPPSIGAYEYTSGGSIPTVTTNTITAITSTTATGGGNVTADGGAAVTDRGICWSTLVNPVITDSHTHDGTGTGAFTSYIISLTNGLTYYVRAYATNTNGTAYGNQRSFVASSTPAADVFIKSGTEFINSGTQLIKIE